MDLQSMQQLGGGGAATQEWHYHLGAGGGGGQPAQVVDGAFLMELLEDAPATEQPQEDDVDRLSRVIRSLEAEIDGRPPANGGSKMTAEHVSAGDDVDGGLLDDMLLSDLDSSPAGPCVAEAALPPFEYWAEVPPAVGHDMGGWYLDGGDGVMVGGYEFREQCYHGYNSESFAVDQVYSPLWE